MIPLEDLWMPHGAIGPLQDLPEESRRVFDPGEDFEPIPHPGPHDWLSVNAEAGQTFRGFLRERLGRPMRDRSRIYLQPLDSFETEKSPSPERLRDFAEAFFGMDARVLPAMEVAKETITSRRNPFTGNTQLLTRDILALLMRDFPFDAYCVLGITMQDLYPDPAWNFVFGEASVLERVGVYSFARYDPRVYQEGPADTGKVVLRRSCKVLAHETCHMFGIRHCVFFHCLMNGSNHLGESDAHPLHLCPVDLRKLQDSVGFDPLDRYRRLRDFWESSGLDDEAAWVEGRLEWIEKGTSA